MKKMRAAAGYAAGLAVLALVPAIPLAAQQPEVRITSEVSNAVRTTIVGSRPRPSIFGTDAGRLSATTPIQGATIFLARSATQQAALDALNAAQQNPSSPQYHQWLTADQFAAEFGASDADLAKVENWLEQQGLTVNGVARSRDQISFSGSVAQIEAAFGTEMHYVLVGGVKHIAPSTDLSVPAAFDGVVTAVNNLSDFRPRPNFRPVPLQATAAFTSGQTGSNFTTPGDTAVIYDINAAYNAGYTGTGQTITVVGQSAIAPADITNFQNAAGTPLKSPNVILMPGTGTSAISSGDEAESDLDIEYSGAIAKGAQINFVYTGNDTRYGAFDALQYAIQNRIGTIINVSYGNCELAVSSTSFATLNASLQQAVTQGQSVIVASGDSGSQGCYNITDEGLSSAQQAALSVNYPADSQYTTSVGGSEFPTSTVAAGNPYWSTTTAGTDIVTSAKSYIPEVPWNDDAVEGQISAGGGGISTLAPRPSWQANVPGIPTGSFRLEPDISLDASNYVAPYLYCSSDTAGTGITGSCSNGFRDVNNKNLTAAGGTSFAAPIFAGMLAIINQKTGNANGQGLVSSELYTLAANSTTYSTAFHDITTGNIGCVLGATYETGTTVTGAAVYGPACPSTAAGLYTANVGYDLATGLGSVDLFNLMTAWPNAVVLTGSSVTVTAATLTPQAGANDTVTVKVASASSSVTTVPTGSVNLTIDGTFVNSLPLVNGVVTYPYSTTATGAHTLSFVYSGDGNFSNSTGTITLTVVASTLKASLTTITPSSTPATFGVADPITITVSGNPTGTPAPTGSVNVSLDGATATTLALVPGSASSTAVYTFPASAALGSHTIAASYLGDSNYQTSSATTLTLGVASPGTFTLSAPALTIPDGNTSTETVTITPANSFSGLVNLTLTTSSVIAEACYTVSSPTVSGTTTAAVTIYTNGSNCPNTATALNRNARTSARNTAPALPRPGLPAGVAMAGLLAFGWLGRRSRKLRGLVALAVLAVAGFAVTGCGSTSTSGSGISTTAPTGTYTVTVTGTDAATGTKTATSTFQLTIQ